MNKTHTSIIKAIISLGIIYFIASHLDIRKLVETFKVINPYLIISAFLINFLLLFVMTAKWEIIIRNITNLSYKALLPIYWASYFIGTFSFGTIGSEIYKLIYLENKKKVLLGSLSDNALSLFWYSISAASFLSTLTISKSFSSTVVFGVILNIILIEIVIFLNEKLGVISKIYNLRIVHKHFGEHTLNSKALRLHSLLSLVVILITSLTYYLVFISIGLSINIAYLIIFIPILKIGVSLPISVQGIGVREYLFLQFAGILLINNEAIIVVSFIIYTLGLVLGLSGIIPFLLTQKQKLNSQ